MKRMLSLFTVLAVLLVVSVPSFAMSKPAEKLKSGATEVVMSPMQVNDNVIAETKHAKFLPFAAMGGLLKGGFYMGKAIVHGTIDVLTFPIDK